MVVFSLMIGDFLFLSSSEDFLFVVFEFLLVIKFEVETSKHRPRKDCRKAGDQMPSRGMPGQTDRAFDAGRRGFGRARDHRRDLGDSRFRRQDVRGRRHRPSRRSGAFREMRPIGFVEFQPILHVLAPCHITCFQSGNCIHEMIAQANIAY